METVESERPAAVFGRPGSRWREWVILYGGPVVVLIALLVLWEVVVVVFRVPRVILPAPSVVLAQIASNPGFLLSQASSTLLETLLGFALSLVLGIPLAVLIVYSRLLENTAYLLLAVMNSIPKVALAPLFIIWMGTGLPPKVAIALMIAIFPIVIDTVIGLRSVPHEMLDLARSMGASHRKVFWKIRFPAALPSILGGAKVAMSLAIVGAIVGEFVGADRGLAYVILTSQGSFNTPRMFAALTVLSVMGITLFYAVDFMERRLLPWHVSHRGDAVGQTP
jgi:NitT/TauT family transport system permease protein